VFSDVLLPEEDPHNYLHELENPKPKVMTNNLEERKESVAVEPQD
jgi:hypothetical protein